MYEKFSLWKKSFDVWRCLKSVSIMLLSSTIWFGSIPFSEVHWRDIYIKIHIGTILFEREIFSRNSHLRVDLTGHKERLSRCKYLLYSTLLSTLHFRKKHSPRNCLLQVTNSDYPNLWLYMSLMQCTNTYF
jgi:hypothetical protein